MKEDEIATPIRYTTDSFSAVFQITDSRAPTDDTTSATFEGSEVTVTGIMDPSGCNRPVLDDVRYNANDGVFHVAIGGKSAYGETATVECGNASFDYRCTLTVKRDQPESVEVVHVYEGKDNQSFTLKRD